MIKTIGLLISIIGFFALVYYGAVEVTKCDASGWKPCCHEVPMGVPCVRCRTS